MTANSQFAETGGAPDLHGAASSGLAAEFLFGGAGVRGGVGHDEAGAALFIERRVEESDPEVEEMTNVEFRLPNWANFALRTSYFAIGRAHGVDVERRMEFGFTDTPAVRFHRFGFRARARCSGEDEVEAAIPSGSRARGDRVLASWLWIPAAHSW